MIPDMSWAERGECRGMDPHLFDLDLHPTGTPEARAACLRCPVRAECAAASRDERGGMIWGGIARRKEQHRPDVATRDAATALFEAGVSKEQVAAELGLTDRQVSAYRNAWLRREKAARRRRRRAV